jgi:AmpD protein
VSETEHLWLPGIRHTPSPNCDARPDRADVSLLVIHNISLPPGRFEGDAVEAFFQNRLDPAAHTYFQEIAALQVSAHLFVRRDGSAQQFVPLDMRAWHAGASCFQGRDCCNDYSIGIELEGSDDTPFTDPQYATLATLTRKIRAHYPGITRERIVGHSDIAPGRKTDPGPRFDWPRYLEEV